MGKGCIAKGIPGTNYLVFLATIMGRAVAPNLIVGIVLVRFVDLSKVFLIWNMDMGNSCVMFHNISLETILSAGFQC